MNRKIPIGIGIAAAVIVVAIVGVKAYFGDSATELPGEEKMENTLNLQESGENGEASNTVSNGVESEAGENGEENEVGEGTK